MLIFSCIIRNTRIIIASQVANCLGVSESTVQRYESGVIANLKYDTIIDLANLFGVDPCYLMGWSAPLHESGALQVTDEEMRLLAFFRSLNDIGKRKALENIGDLTQIEKYVRVAEGNRNAV